MVMHPTCTVLAHYNVKDSSVLALAFRHACVTRSEKAVQGNTLLRHSYQYINNLMKKLILYICTLIKVPQSWVLSNRSGDMI